MKVVIKKVMLGMIAGILAISGVFGQSEGEIVEKIKLGLHLEKFKKVKVVNNLNLLFKAAKVELVNEAGLVNQKSTTISVVGKENSTDFEIGSPYKFVFTLTLEPQGNSPDQLSFVSQKKSIDLSSGTATINDIFSDVVSKPAGKVNVLFAKDPSEKDTLLVTIK